MSKTFINLQRMSEDVDLKLVLTGSGKTLKTSGLKRVLSQLKKDLSQLFETAGFKFDTPKAQNSNHFIEYELEYAPTFNIAEALRPFLKIQLTVSGLSGTAENHEVSSLVNQVVGEPPEVTAFCCVDVVQTASEKLVSLLRRTAARLRGINDWNDDALIRHIYDLHKISQHYELGSTFCDIVKLTVKADGVQYKNRNPEFLMDPANEIRTALLVLQTDAIFKQQYANFLGPLVYSADKPTYEEGLATITRLAEKVWGSAISNDAANL